MKNLFFVSIAFSIFVGTSFTAAAQPAPNFIKGIELQNDQRTASYVEVNSVAVVPFVNDQVQNNIPIKHSFVGLAKNSLAVATEKCSRLQFKFAQMLEREVESLSNLALLDFLDDWWGTRYRYGGSTKSGIDCSAFVSLLMTSVYSLSIPRTAKAQYAASAKINKDEMLEGDLVFFNTRGGVSHVGLYLGSGYFAHASVSSGVTISNLDETYYAKRFIGATRLQNELNNTSTTRLY